MEEIVEQAQQLSPDLLADTYVELTSDLAFAQTYYPHSRITIYLNNLSSALHNLLYKNKKEKWSRVITYWTHEVPLVMYHARKLLLYSGIIFLVSVLVGVISALQDLDFPRLIMGDAYVEMTLRNIEAGEPMAVYGSMNSLYMFLAITMNNIMVSFNVFAMGLLTSFGTGYMLFRNGVMIGAFQTFFFQQGLLGESMLAIWLHGTLEIWSIVVAGAAGLAIGNGWLFPGTHSRLTSFARGAKQGVKIIIGAVPIFIVAGFIEAFFTRHTHYPPVVRLGIILLSLAFIIYYYFYLPNKRYYERTNS
nr:stage II sporulation protein M [Bacteroides sp. 214]